MLHRVRMHHGKPGISWNLEKYIPDMEYHGILPIIMEYHEILKIPGRFE